MGVQWEGTTKDWIKKLEKETDKAVGVAAETLVQEIQDSMPGARASKVGTGKNAKYTPSVAGNPPGVRTARLKNSISSQRAGKLKRVVGTNVEYAAIHEFGGTIAHPGGTAYKIVGPGKAVFVKNSEATAGMKRTKPHNITIPPRPFMKPGLQRARKKMLKRFTASLRKGMR